VRTTKRHSCLTLTLESLLTPPRRFAHATHNPDNWLHLPAEMRPVVHKILSDRFWQAGISDGSKDDFYARVIDKKNTVEGLASTIRGSVRFVRETAYAIIYCMSRLDLQFYGVDGLSGPLSNALFADSIWLSTHQQTNLLNLVRYLVDDCPVDHREQFLPQLISACFRQMDAKINGEWEKMEQQQQSTSVDGEAGLKEEMKTESILRQVTYTAVMMVADFLDPTKSSTATLSHMSIRWLLTDFYQILARWRLAPKMTVLGTKQRVDFHLCGGSASPVKKSSSRCSYSAPTVSA